MGQNYREKPELLKELEKSDFLSGAPGGTRIPDPLLRRQLLYPTELQAHREVINSD